MKFSELSQAITKAEKDRGIERICPYCQSKKWGIGAIHKYIATFGVDQRSHLVMPCIIMTCMNCGNTLILNPYILGFDDSYFKEEIVNGQ